MPCSSCDAGSFDGPPRLGAILASFSVMASTAYCLRACPVLHVQTLSVGWMERCCSSGETCSINWCINSRIGIDQALQDMEV